MYTPDFQSVEDVQRSFAMVVTHGADPMVEEYMELVALDTDIEGH